MMGIIDDLDYRKDIMRLAAVASLKSVIENLMVDSLHGIMSLRNLDKLGV